MKYVIYCSKNYLAVYSSENKECRYIYFDELDVDKISDAVKTACFNASDEIYIFLSGALFYNLLIEVPFVAFDPLSKILPNLVGNYHFEKNHQSSFKCIIHSINEADKKALVSYIPEKQINIFIECFRQYKLKTVSTIHSAAAEYCRINKINKIDIFSKDENLVFTIENNDRGIFNIRTLLYSGAAENTGTADEDTKTIAINQIFEGGNSALLIQALKNKRIYSFVSKTGFNEFSIKLLKDNINKHTLILVILLLIFYAGYRYAIMKSLENRYLELKKISNSEFKKQFPHTSVIIDPLQQAKNEVQKSNELLNFYVSSSNLSLNSNKIINEIFVILNKHNVTLNQISLKKNIIAMSGEADSIGELDKIKIEVANQIQKIEEIKILNSKYKNIITNTGAEFDIEVVLKNQ